MSNNTSRNTNAITIPVPVELLPYQDWSYVGVICDYHKHLGDEISKSKLALINEVIKPFRKQKGDGLAALRFMTLALYMGGIMTEGCRRALELVRDHHLNQLAQKESKPEAKKKEEATRTSPSKTEMELATKGFVSAKTIDEEAKERRRRNTPSSTPTTAKPTQLQTKPVEKSFEDRVDEAVFGSVQKAKEVRNDFFGYDLDAAFNMDFETSRRYIEECRRVGWRNVKI